MKFVNCVLLLFEAVSLLDGGVVAKETRRAKKKRTAAPSDMPSQLPSDLPSQPPSSAPTQLDQLLMCRTDEKGFPVSIKSPFYEIGTAVFSDYSVQETQVQLYNIATAMNDFSQSLSESYLELFTFKAVVQAISSAKSGPKSLGSFLAQLTGKAVTNTLIVSQFKETREQILLLADQVNKGFLGVKTELGDQQLDDIMGRLASIRNAYDAFLSAQNATVQPGTLSKYTVSLR